MSLANLFEEAKAGGELDRERLIAFLRQRFLIIARRRVVGDEAEDLVQEACMTVIEKLKSQAPKDHFEAWAHQILRNKIGNYFQSARRRSVDDPSLFERTADDTVYSERHLLRDQIRDCLGEVRKVRPIYLRVLNLAQHGFSTKDICKKIGVNPNNLYVMLNRSRNLLRECLKAKGRTR